MNPARTGGRAAGATPVMNVAAATPPSISCTSMNSASSAPSIRPLSDDLPPSEGRTSGEQRGRGGETARQRDRQPSSCAFAPERQSDLVTPAQRPSQISVRAASHSSTAPTAVTATPAIAGTSRSGRFQGPAQPTEAGVRQLEGDQSGCNERKRHSDPECNRHRRRTGIRTFHGDSSVPGGPGPPARRASQLLGMPRYGNVVR